jgi:hypothetical protein
MQFKSPDETNLQDDKKKLYSLIYRRTLASVMTPSQVLLLTPPHSSLLLTAYCLSLQFPPLYVRCLLLSMQFYFRWPFLPFELLLIVLLSALLSSSSSSLPSSPYRPPLCPPLLIVLLSALLSSSSSSLPCSPHRPPLYPAPLFSPSHADINKDIRHRSQGS